MVVLQLVFLNLLSIIQISSICAVNCLKSRKKVRNIKIEVFVKQLNQEPHLLPQLCLFVLELFNVVDDSILGL
jgi:hypothetical protein